MNTEPFPICDIIQCPECRGALRLQDTTSYQCHSCNNEYPFKNNVLLLQIEREADHIISEREAAKTTEQTPELGGINQEFEDLANATGELRDAILALPFGNDSKFYSEPGYFQNVQKHSVSYRYILDNLPITKGDSVLDLGADLTWSTQQLALRGACSIAVDINHHLEVGSLYQEYTGSRYHMINADMHSAAFQDEAFDCICAFSVLHHSSDIVDLVSNLYRVLKPGGFIGIVEPYCLSSAHKEAFGKEQIEEGINENIYTIAEWQQAFESAGFRFEKVMVNNGFNAILRKPETAQLQDTDSVIASADLFKDFYSASILLEVRGEKRKIEKGSTFTIPLTITNTGQGIFCSEGLLPVMVSYHLYKKEGLFKKKTLLSFDNSRTALPKYLHPGESSTLELLIDSLSETGSYIAEIDIVREGAAWFSQHGNDVVSTYFDIY